MKRLGIILSILALLLGCGALGYYWLLVRGPLAGDTSHDFGVVAITADRTDVTHTFHLTNRTDHTVRIERIVPDCGCVQFTPGSAVVEPGQSVDLPATMSVYSDGVKRVDVRLLLGDSGVQHMHLTATGRREASAIPQTGQPAARQDSAAQSTLSAPSAIPQ